MTEPVDVAGEHRPSRASAVSAGVIVVLLVVVMGQLGLWQMRRHADVAAQNDAIIARASTAVPLAAVSFEDPEAVDFQRVTARGIWRPEDEVLWFGRSRNSVTGKEVLTPLELVDADDQPTGEALLVDRGWVPDSFEEPDRTEFSPPSGIVEVEGILRQSVDQPGFGAKDPPEGRLAVVFHADVPRIGQQVEVDLLPMYLRLDGDDPAASSEVLRPLAATEPDAGPHRGYAFQWFAFSATAVVAYLAWLRKRRQAR